MAKTTPNKNDPELKSFAEEELAVGDSLDRDNFPELYNISSAFLYRYTYRPISEKLPEFVYVPFRTHKIAENEVAIHKWNMSWESGHLRSELCKANLPAKLEWLTKFEDNNLYLLPDIHPKYQAYLPLYHLLPQRTLNNFHLPLFKKGFWPIGFSHELRMLLLQDGFENAFSEAFAHHIWPLLVRGSKIRAFTKDDPIVLLSHNLDHWLPYAYHVAEERLRSFPRVDYENSNQEHEIRQLQQEMPSNVEVNRPLKGGAIWLGEDDAWQATKELVEVADRKGRLRAIIEAVQSNRIEDDFSDYWSYAREDFERKLYHKRSKVKVSFVQLDDTIPIHGPNSELEENLLWEDFLALLDRKEKRVVVCIRNGFTKVSEISKLLGYANHSPVSKALKKIQQKARLYLELD